MLVQFRFLVVPLLLYSVSPHRSRFATTATSVHPRKNATNQNVENVEVTERTRVDEASLLNILKPFQGVHRLVKLRFIF